MMPFTLQIGGILFVLEFYHTRHFVCERGIETSPRIYALKNSDFADAIDCNYGKDKKKNSRKRNIIWINPSFI